MNYYVYEILIDDEVIYVGSSQSVDERYHRDDPHHYVRLRAHGFFVEKYTAQKRLKENNLGRYKKEILKAISENKKLSFNIAIYGVNSKKAAEIEKNLISKYGIKLKTKLPFLNKNYEIDFKEIESGQLINKNNGSIFIPKNDKGSFSKDCIKKGNSWWNNITEEEKKIYKSSIKKRRSKFREENPKKHKLQMEKMRVAGTKATSKEFRKESTRLKQSENLKRRWKRGESWIEAKNEQSRKFMKALSETPEFKERSRNQCIKRNKDPEWQLKKVKKLYLAITKYKKDFDRWKESYEELVAEGLYPQKSFRDWKKYFNDKNELIKYCNEN